MSRYAPPRCSSQLPLISLEIYGGYWFRACYRKQRRRWWVHDFIFLKYLTFTKGVCLEFYETSLCFVASHFAAHQEKIEDRNSNYAEIIGGIRIGKKNQDLLNQFHHIFWFGDLNYRYAHIFENFLIYFVTELICSEKRCWICSSWTLLRSKSFMSPTNLAGKLKNKMFSMDGLRGQSNSIQLTNTKLATASTLQKYENGNANTCNLWLLYRKIESHPGATEFCGSLCLELIASTKQITLAQIRLWQGKFIVLS